MADVRIAADWKEALASEFSQPYFDEIVAFLKREKSLGKVIYPKGSDIFHAFDATPLERVRVVILGQDPYHQPGQAHGLCFSVPQGINPPPSLVNIFKEMASDLEVAVPRHGNLESWASQGVLLLNASLTVEANRANSHAQIGWHRFTDAVIATVSRQCAHVVFILWGRFAQSKAPLIDRSKHLVLRAAHPSPLSAYQGFFGSKPFSQTNAWLQQQGLPSVDWAI